MRGGSAAPSGSFSPVRRATTAVAPMPRPMADRVDQGLHRFGETTVAIASAPRCATKKMSTTAKSDSRTVSSTHRDGEQHQRAPDGAVGEVLLRAAALAEGASSGHPRILEHSQ